MRENSLSGMIRSYEKGRKKINLDCHFYQKDLFDITIPFKKRSDVFTTGPTYFDTTTKKLCLFFLCQIEEKLACGSTWCCCIYVTMGNEGILIFKFILFSEITVPQKSVTITL